MSASGFRAFAALCLAAFSMAAARAAPPPLEAYGKLARIEYMRLSPTGDRYAFIRVTDHARQLIVVPVAGGTPTAVNFGVKDKIRDVQWAGEDHVLMTVSATANVAGIFTVDSIETDQVVVLPLNGKPSFMVFEGHDDVVPVVTGRYGVANVNGRWYGYFGAVTRTKTMTGSIISHAFSDLYRVDLDTGVKLVIARAAITSTWVGG